MAGRASIRAGGRRNGSWGERQTRAGSGEDDEGGKAPSRLVLSSGLTLSFLSPSVSSRLLIASSCVRAQ
jgi:hypothetical protein